MLLIFAQNYRERLCRRNALYSSQHSSKLTVVKPEASSATNDAYRCNVIWADAWRSKMHEWEGRLSGKRGVRLRTLCRPKPTTGYI